MYGASDTVFYGHDVDTVEAAADFRHHPEICIPIHHVDEKVSIGSAFSLADLESMKQFTRVIRLHDPEGKDDKVYKRYDHITYKEICIKDAIDSNIAQHFVDCNQFIEASPGKVLVHCFAGVSRSATVVLAYMMYKGASLAEALALLRSKRSVVSPNPSFMKQLIEYEKTARRCSRKSELRAVARGACGLVGLDAAEHDLAEAGASGLSVHELEVE